MQNNRHLGSALNLYIKAVELCRKIDAPREKMIMAMSGRGRLESWLGQITRLKRSSLELLEFDPGNSQALDQLQAIQISTGNLLPARVSEIICGERTTEEWVADLQAAGDESALRWTLEKLVADTDSVSISNLSNLFQVLNAGKSSGKQLAQLGRIKESAIDLLQAWKADGTLDEKTADLFVVRENLRENKLQEAISLLQQIDFDGVDNPEVLLLGANLYDSFNLDESRQRSIELLAKADESVGDRPEMMLQIAIRNWNDGRSAKCFELLDRARKAMPDNEIIKLNALILSAIGNKDLIEDSQSDLESLLDDPNLDATSYERVLTLQKVLEFKSAEDVDPAEIRNYCGNFGKWVSDPLMLCLLGDLARQAGLNELAVRAYRSASKVAGGFSLPISGRLIGASGKTSGSASGAWSRARPQEPSGAPTVCIYIGIA